MEKCIDKKNLEHIYESGYHEVVSYGKVDREPNEDDLEELWHFSFNEIEGEWDIKDGSVIDAPHLLPLNLQKHNIETNDNSKLALIGDYWDEKTTKEIFDLLRQYKDVFP